MEEETTTEIWKDIPGYENFYQISNIGRVKSLKRKVKKLYGYKTISEKILKPIKNSKGYFIVNLYKENKMKSMKLHRLVAEAFIDNPENLPQINHKNERKEDNRVTNLEFCDARYNTNFGTRNERAGIAISKVNTNNPKRSKAVKCIETNQIYPSTMEVSRRFGFNPSCIAKCCRGEIKSSYKLHWKYV